MSDLPDVLVFPEVPAGFSADYLSPPASPVDWLAIWGWTPAELAEFDRD